MQTISTEGRKRPESGPPLLAPCDAPSFGLRPSAWPGWPFIFCPRKASRSHPGKASGKAAAALADPACCPERAFTLSEPRPPGKVCRMTKSGRKCPLKRHTSEAGLWAFVHTTGRVFEVVDVAPSDGACWPAQRVGPRLPCRRQAPRTLELVVRRKGATTVWPGPDTAVDTHAGWPARHVALAPCRHRSRPSRAPNDSPQTNLPPRPCRTAVTPFAAGSSLKLPELPASPAPACMRSHPRSTWAGRPPPRPVHPSPPSRVPSRHTTHHNRFRQCGATHPPIQRWPRSVPGDSIGIGSSGRLRVHRHMPCKPGRMAHTGLLRLRRRTLPTVQLGGVVVICVLGTAVGCRSG